MNMQKLIGVGVAASFLVSAGIAAAQTTAPANGVSVTSTPNTSAVAPGTGVAVGTFTVTGDQSGGSINSLPITVTPGSGASAANLSNCQLYNANGTALGAAFTPSAGSNSFSFNPAYSVGNGSATLTVRCDVAGGTPSGSTFQFLAGAPVYTTGINTTIDTAPSVPAGSTDVALANISLDATRSSGVVNLSTVPVTVTTGNGASTADLSNCHIQDSVSGATISNALALTDGAQATFSLNSAYPTVGGMASMLTFACDLAPATPIGSSFTVSINPASFTATNGSTGSPVTVGQVVGTGANGLPAALSGTVVVSGATSGSTTGTGSTGTSGTPGVPNTGMGGMAMTYLMVLLLSGVVALTGFKQFAKRS